MTKLWTIAVNTFVETVRQPIYLVLLLVTFGVLVLDVPMAAYSMDVDFEQGDKRMLMDLGLSTLMMAGLFFSAFSASRVLTGEIESQTVLTVVSKPVPRVSVLLGKFLGVAAATTVAYYLCCLVLLMTVRHGVVSATWQTHDRVVIFLGVGAFLLTVLGAGFCNYFFGWQFSGAAVTLALLLGSTAMGIIAFVGKEWTVVPFGEGIPLKLLVVILLLWMAVILMTAFAIAVSTRLSQLATLGACVGFFAVSLILDGLLRPYAETNLVARVVCWVLPSLSYFFTLDTLTQGSTLPGQYLWQAALYALACTAALLLLGMALFQTREMQKREGGTSAPGLVNIFAWTMRVAALAAALAGLSVLGGHLTQKGAALAGAGVVGGALLWLFAGFLGSGARWAFFLLLFLIAVQLIGSVVNLLLKLDLLGPGTQSTFLLLSAVLGAYAMLMSLSRATWDHFARRRPAILD